MTNWVTCRNPSPPCLGVSRSYAVPWSSYTGGRPRSPNPEVSLLKSHWLVGWAGAWYKGLISWPMWGCSVNPPSLICHPLGWTCYILTEYARWASIPVYSGSSCHNAAGVVLPSLAWLAPYLTLNRPYWDLVIDQPPLHQRGAGCGATATLVLEWHIIAQYEYISEH